MQVLERLEGGFFAVADPDLVLVCHGLHSVGNPALVGLCFRIGPRWRCLRNAMVDIGIELTRTDAISRIIADHTREEFELTDNLSRYGGAP
jgi:hypothetical protein